MLFFDVVIPGILIIVSSIAAIYFALCVFDPWLQRWIKRHSDDDPKA